MNKLSVLNLQNAWMMTKGNGWSSRKKLCQRALLGVCRRSYKTRTKTGKVHNVNAGYQVIHPGIVSKVNEVPKHISRPDYSKNSLLRVRHNKAITINSEEVIRRMRETCGLTKSVLKKAASILEPGITTDDIDILIHREIIGCGGYPSTLNYKGFPKSCCTSVNNIVCHGIPDSTILHNGDIINIDVSVFYLGCHGDTSDTFAIGKVDEGGSRLISATHECLQHAMAVCKPGTKFSQIGMEVEPLANERGFQVCRRFVGHGIGESFHEWPNVWHAHSIFADRREMQPGMIFTIEPILMEGNRDVTTMQDSWTVVSNDKKRSAQAEHTLLVTRDGHEVLTA